MSAAKPAPVSSATPRVISRVQMLAQDTPAWVTQLALPRKCTA